MAETKSPDSVGASAFFGAGNETRTRDPNLGKVVLYQLSYSRTESGNSSGASRSVKAKNYSSDNAGQAARKYSTIDHSVSAAAM